MAIEGDHLYAAVGDEVRLLSLATGAETWRATLTDKVTTRCASCFAVVQKKLVVRTDDAYLTGFQASSNEPLWSRRLNSTQAAPSAGGNLLLVDDNATPSEPGAVETLDPATGRAARRFTPVCPPSDDNPYPGRFGAGDPVVAVPGTGDLVALFGSSTGCVVRWESASGTQRWTLSVTGDFSIGDEPPLVSDRDLVFGSYGSLIHVDLGSGRACSSRRCPTPPPSPTPSAAAP
ncbi:MAG: PQQ-binding-like beta-propeller repeat protein [Acidimicrobiales bacterium]